MMEGCRLACMFNGGLNVSGRLREQLNGLDGPWVGGVEV